MKNQFAVLIPAYNAEGTISDVLRIIAANGWAAEVVVIDDGSLDETAKKAGELGATVISHERNRGKGAALTTGFRWILDNKEVDAVVTVDADLQHDIRDLTKFIDARNKSGANIVLGRRKRLGSGMPLSRILSNSITSLLVSARTGMFIPDSQCGYRLIGREVLENIVVESEGFEAETELLIRAAGHGFHIASVPVQTVYRGETSHMTHWTTTKRFIRTLLKEY
ncbi:MAG: glycosyltransferase family 2 protein [Bacteroidota bacterium]